MRFLTLTRRVIGCNFAWDFKIRKAVAVSRNHIFRWTADTLAMTHAERSGPFADAGYRLVVYENGLYRPAVRDYYGTTTRYRRK